MLQEAAHRSLFSEEEKRACRQERRMLCESDNCQELGADANRTYLRAARTRHPARVLSHEDASFAASRAAGI